MKKTTSKKSNKLENERKNSKQSFGSRYSKKSTSQIAKQSSRKEALRRTSNKDVKPNKLKGTQLNNIPEQPPIKEYEIKGQDDTIYKLIMEKVNNKIKFKVIEKDSFPQNEYENYYSLEDLIKFNEWFKIFYDIESFLTEIDKFINNGNAEIYPRNSNVMNLSLVFPIDLLDRIDIPLPLNEINNEELFSELILKIKEIETKDNNEIASFNENLNNIEQILANLEAEANKQEEENNKQNYKEEGKKMENAENVEGGEHLGENENKNLDNENKDLDQKDNNNSQLEKMKNALKEEIKNNIKKIEVNRENVGEEKLIIDEGKTPFSDSEILSSDEKARKEEISLLLEWLTPSLLNMPKKKEVLYTKLIYNSNTDGLEGTKFHEKCDNYGPTVIIFETNEGYKFGGFASVCWESGEKEQFKADPFAFIFSFDTKKKYKVIDPSKSILCDKNWGPIFGDFTIYAGHVSGGADNIEPKWPSTYNLMNAGELTNGNEGKLNIKKYEVFGIEDKKNNENENKEK